MVGRDSERSRLSTLVAVGDGRALVLRGEAGIGKSALLDEVARLATGADHRVVRAAGVEAEAGLPFAGLHQLLRPLLPGVDGLEQVHRTVFGTVFGWNDGKPPSVMSLGVAVLDLLSLVSSDRPLLLLVDDGQWLDASSVAVLRFVGRRLTGSSVKLVVGLRSDIASGFDTAALPQLPVRVLDDTEARELLRLSHPDLDASVRRLVLDQAQGNPLALLELPAHLMLGPAKPAAAEPFGLHDASLPVLRRLQHVYSTRMQELDGHVREELLRGALDGVGAAFGAECAAGPGRYRMRDAGQAVTAGLLRTDPLGGGVVFRHPLVRSTVAQMATPNERRAAHAELARMHRDDLHRRAVHLAASAVDPNDEVADVLEAAAESAARRGATVAAAAWLTRAAELSEDRESRSHRFGDAAFVAGHTGAFGHGQRLVRAGRTGGTEEPPASVVTSAYRALWEDGDVQHTHHRVTDAIECLRAQEPDRTSETLTGLVNVLLAIDQYAADPVQWGQTRALLDSLGELVPQRSRVYGDAWGDVVRHGGGVLERVEKEFTGLAQLEPWDVTRLGVAAYHVDTLSRYRPHLERMVDREAATGFARNSMTSQHLIMLDQIAVGEWDEAERTGRRCLQLTTTHGYLLLTHHSRAYLGLLAALRGQVERARELQAQVDAWARP
ncbi:ATP-binding protein, partial [Streptomyces sp. NPDC093516]|uniref:ATP-binding protein n=1 Tax=Streptomyces sp. NPDC093516 TaxID=3155304 RepID=UPI00342C865F